MDCDQTCAAVLIDPEASQIDRYLALAARDGLRTSTLAAETRREVGFQRAVALDGGMKAWREAGYPTEAGPRTG